MIELTIAIALLAVVVTIAAPSFDNATLGSRLSSYGNNLLVSANLARSEAIKRNAVVRMCVSADGTSCASAGGWEQGWIVFLPNGGEVISRQQPTPVGLRITSNGFREVNFQPTGVGATFFPAPSSAAQFTVCRATPTVGWQERVVALTLTGRASVSRTTEGSCPS